MSKSWASNFDDSMSAWTSATFREIRRRQTSTSAVVTSFPPPGPDRARSASRRSASESRTRSASVARSGQR